MDDRLERTPANSELEMHIISNTYRSIVDQNAFDELMANWTTKLDELNGKKADKNNFSTAFLQQLKIAQKTLEDLDIQPEEGRLERLVSEVAGPALVLSPDLRIAAINIDATRAYDRQNGAFFDKTFIDAASVADFESLLRSAKGQGNLDQAILSITPANQNPFYAEAFLVRLPNQTKAHIAIRTLDLIWSEATSEKLRQAFDLSSTEADVAKLFFQTCSLQKITEIRGASLNTVRTQMKTIQAKTGANSQADLIRLLSMVASRQMLERRSVLSKWEDPLGREAYLDLEDGRRIAWTWMGAKNGTPAVMLRGLGMGYLWPPETEARLIDAGIKLYIPSRPGYGNSSMHKSLDVLEDNLVSLHAFMDQIVQEPCVGIGMSDGIIPLLAEQDSNPGRFLALVAVGYSGILNRKAVMRLPAIQITTSRLAKQAPRILELIGKLGHRMMERHGVDWYLERSYKTMPLDLQTCRDPDTSALVQNACAHLLVQGHLAFVRDMQLFHADVDGAIDRLTVPLRCLMPTDDGVFDLAEYQELTQRNPLVSIVPVEDAGDLLIYQKTDEVIDQIIEVIASSQ